MPWQYDREDDCNVYNLFIICKNINKNKQKNCKNVYILFVIVYFLMPCGAGAWRRVAVRRGKQSDRPLPTGTRTEPAKKRSLTAD